MMPLKLPQLSPSTTGTAPAQPVPVKSEQEEVWTALTPQATGDAVVTRPAVSHVLPEKLVSFGHARVAGLVAGQHVAEVMSIGDSAATKPWLFASFEEMQSSNTMRSVRSLGAPFRPQMCQPGEQASSAASQLPKSFPLSVYPHHLPVRVLRKSPELVAVLMDIAHPAML